MSAKAVKSGELRGWHVLLILIGFFAVVIAVDVGMAVQAYRTFPGEVTAKPYEDGLAFNTALARRQEERSLGWRASIETTVLGAGSALRSGRVQLRLKISDNAGQPVRGLTLRGRLERPATESGRLDLQLTETRPGTYDATAPDTPGAWDISISGQDRTGRAFEAQRRLTWR